MRRFSASAPGRKDEQGKPELNKIRKEVDLDIIIPGQTLGGFVLKSIEVVKLGGRSNVHLKYTDGLITLSVFQSRPDEDARGGRFGGWLRKRGEGEGKPPWREDDIKKMEIQGVECEVVSRGPTAIFRWIQNGVHLILMGELGQKELAGIVGSFISKGK
jgi:hypothetical protein